MNPRLSKVISIEEVLPNLTTLALPDVHGNILEDLLKSLEKSTKIRSLYIAYPCSHSMLLQSFIENNTSIEDLIVVAIRLSDIHFF